MLRILAIGVVLAGCTRGAPPGFSGSNDDRWELPLVGPLEDGQWRRLAQHGSRRGEDGTYTLACDPAIVSTLRRGGNAGVEFGNDFLFGINLWPVWDAVECPTLVLRGAESDLLLKSTVRRMQDGGPRVELVEFAGIGHAPWLMSEDQIGPVSEFILAAEPLRR